MTAGSHENLGTQSSQFYPLEWPFPAATLLFGMRLDEREREAGGRG